MEGTNGNRIQNGIRRESGWRGTFNLLWGDKFLTDDDWLDDEFRAAKNRYHGRPREEIMTEVERKQGEESRKFMQKCRCAFLERQQEQAKNE